MTYLWLLFFVLAFAFFFKRELNKSALEKQKRIEKKYLHDQTQRKRNKDLTR